MAALSAIDTFTDERSVSVPADDALLVLLAHAPVDAPAEQPDNPFVVLTYDPDNLPA